MKLLLLGGTGNISWWCVEAALRNKFEVTILNRGETLATRRRAQAGVRHVHLDVTDMKGLARFVQNERFDVVSDFIAYSAEDVQKRWEILEPVCDKFVYISSTIIFDRNEHTGPLSEVSLQRQKGLNRYIDGKLDIEQVITADSDWLERSLILRPAHTFDTNVPTPLGSNCFTDIQRLLDGRSLLVPNDGTGLWTIMHSSDFARAWIRLIDNDAAFGNAVNVVGDEVLDWNQISDYVLRALELPRDRLKYVSSKAIEAVEISDRPTADSCNLGANYKLHRKWNDLYDISRLRSLIHGWECHRSFHRGFEETINWLRADPARIRINSVLRLALDELEYAADFRT